MTLSDEIKFNTFLDKLIEEGDSAWLEQDSNDSPEGQHPSKLGY